MSLEEKSIKKIETFLTNFSPSVVSVANLLSEGESVYFSFAVKRENNVGVLSVDVGSNSDVESLHMELLKMARDAQKVFGQDGYGVKVESQQDTPPVSVLYVNNPDHPN